MTARSASFDTVAWVDRLLRQNINEVLNELPEPSAYVDTSVRDLAQMCRRASRRVPATSKGVRREEQ